jgi:hypothetical protein
VIRISCRQADRESVEHVGDVNKMVPSIFRAALDTSRRSSDRSVTVPYEDFDDETLHVCETGEDGWLNVVAGPCFESLRSRMNALFEFMSVSPDGFSRRVLFNIWCPRWRSMDHPVRLEKLRNLLAAATSVWGNDVDIQKDPRQSCGVEKIVEIIGGRPIHKAGINAHPCSKDGAILDDIGDPYPKGRHHVPELKDFLEASADDPEALFSLIGSYEPGAKVRITNEINDMLANGPRRHLLREAFRRMPWLPMFGADAFSDERFAATGVVKLDHVGVAVLLSKLSERDDLTVSTRIVQWFDCWGNRNGRQVPDLTPSQMALADMLPASWRPGDRLEMDAFRFLTRSILHVAFFDLPNAASLLMHSKGRYVQLYERLLEDVGPYRNVWTALGDIRDFIQSASDDLGMVAGSDRPPMGTAFQMTSSLASATKKLISPDGGIRLLLELSDRWHDVVRAKQQAEDDDVGETSDHRWPRAVEDFTTSSGCMVVELRTQAQLIHEGRTQAHCVGGYSRRCAFGGSHVFSIRSAGIAMSTVEVRFGDIDTSVVKVVQHQGSNRHKPVPEAETALEEWLAAVRGGMLEVKPRPVQSDRLAVEIRRSSLSLDEWRPFLAKPMADLPEAEFRVEIERLRSEAIEPWLAKKTSNRLTTSDGSREEGHE